MITPQQVQEHVETDLEVSAIQRYIDDAVSDIEARYGSTGTRLDRPALPHLARRLWLTAPAASITTLREGYASTTLAPVEASAYELAAHGLSLARLDGQRWGRVVEVTYVPRDEQARRDRVTLDLVRLALQYTALQHETSGDYSSNPVAYQQERDKLLMGLMAGRLPLA